MAERPGTAETFSKLIYCWVRFFADTNGNDSEDVEVVEVSGYERRKTREIWRKLLRET